MKQKIIFLIRDLDLGGAQRQLTVLARFLDRNHFDPVVLCFYRGGHFESDLKSSHVAIRYLEKKGRWDVFGFLLNLKNIIRKEYPDILYSFLGVSNLLAVFMKLFQPRLRVIWGIRSSNTNLLKHDWLSHVVLFAERLFSRWTDAIIVNSEAGRTYCLTHGFPHDKTFTVCNGIDTAQFIRDEEGRISFRKRWAINDDEILIGHVGRFDPSKDHPTLIKALRLLMMRGINFKSVFMGTGTVDYLSHLKKLAVEEKISQRIIWATPEIIMRAVYSSFDLLCLSSIVEGFPNVVAEAMACEVPCVVTAAGDAASIVGQTGRIVPARDPEALAEALYNLFQYDRRALGRQARVRIITEYSVNNLINNTEVILCPKV